MIVTDIVELDKKRSKIFIDGEFSFVLYKGELRDYSIREGHELSDIPILLNKFPDLPNGLFALFCHRITSLKCF